MNDQADTRQAEAARGLCATCLFGQVIRSDRGSEFLMCLRSKTDPRFPRYPPLPVRACRGYEATGESGGGPG
jgi:hypothetical protein